MTIDPVNERRFQARLALVLLAVGWLLPVLCWAFWLPQVLLWVACGAVLLAFSLAAIAWRHPLAKLTVIGAVAFGLIAVCAVQRGLPTYPLVIRPTAAWMQPLKTNWITQSAAKPYSIQTDSAIQLDGEDSLRFELRAGDTWVDQTFLRTHRAEVTIEGFSSRRRGAVVRAECILSA